MTTTNYETFKLTNDAGKDVRFTGERIAHTYTSPDQGNSYFSGEIGRSVVWNLYRTKAGKYVGEKISRSQWQGESDHHEVAVLADEAEVIDFFGVNKLGKDIFDEAGIECIEEIE